MSERLTRILRFDAKLIGAVDDDDWDSVERISVARDEAIRTSMTDLSGSELTALVEADSHLTRLLIEKRDAAREQLQHIKAGKKASSAYLNLGVR
ncbi:MAG: hypothetical protein AAAFM81_04895 [Pseudomonadota bacterium]